MQLDKLLVSMNLTSSSMQTTIWYYCRAVGAGETMVPPNLGKSVNPISTRGRQIIPTTYYMPCYPPLFSGLPAALYCIGGSLACSLGPFEKIVYNSDNNTKAFRGKNK